MVPFLLHSRRTAGGAERSPTDLVESKGRVGGETTKKKEERKGESGRWEVPHLYSVTIWVDGSLQ